MLNFRGSHLQQAFIVMSAMSLLDQRAKHCVLAEERLQRMG
jgi:hypothetical protein